VQEALTNARKHAHATQIQVSLFQDNGALRLKIEDNGQGFSRREASRRNNGNFGLSTMQERANEIGAQLKIRSEVGVGTQVILKLDIAEDKNRAT